MVSAKSVFVFVFVCADLAKITSPLSLARPNCIPRLQSRLARAAGRAGGKLGAASRDAILLLCAATLSISLRLHTFGRPLLPPFKAGPAGTAAFCRALLNTRRSALGPATASGNELPPASWAARTSTAGMGFCLTASGRRSWETGHSDGRRSSTVSAHFGHCVRFRPFLTVDTIFLAAHCHPCAASSHIDFATHRRPSAPRQTLTSGCLGWSDC